MNIIKIIVFTTNGDGDFRNKWSYQNIYSFEEAFSKNEKIDVTFLGFPKDITDFGIWLKKKQIKIDEYDYCFFTILSSSHASLTLKFMKNFEKVKLEKIVYIIDYWKYDKKSIDCYIKKIKPNVIFYAYHDNNNDFGKFGCRNAWIPLAENPKTYKIREKISKKKEFIQFGRKNLSDFEKIRKIAKEKNWKITDTTQYSLLDRINPFSYYYKKESADELSKLIQRHYFGFVSYSSLENRKKIGDISPITPRYYQILLSGTLPIGQFPKVETEKLFGDNIFRIELTDENINKIEEVLEDEGYYMKCIQENYNYILKNHTYFNRVDAMVEFLITGKRAYK